MIAESSLEVTISSFIDIKQFYTAVPMRATHGRSLAGIGYTPTKWVSLLFSLAMIGSLAYYVGSLFFVVWRNFDRFKEDQTYAIGWHGALEEVRLKTKANLLFPLLFVGRRVALGAIAIWGES